MTEISVDFAKDADPFTVEDGYNDDVNGPLPDINPDDYPDTQR